MVVGALTLVHPAKADDLLPRGFSFCVSPDRPPYMSNPATFETDAAVHLCQARNTRLAADLGTYRSCLLLTATKTVKAGNDALAAFRCRSGQKDACGP